MSICLAAVCSRLRQNEAGRDIWSWVNSRVGEAGSEIFERIQPPSADDGSAFASYPPRKGGKARQSGKRT